MGGSPLIKKAKDRMPQKRRNSKKVGCVVVVERPLDSSLMDLLLNPQMDRETLSLPVANSQFYTNTITSISNMLSPIAQTPVEKENKDPMSLTLNTSNSAPSTSSILTTPQTPVFELKEEVRSYRN
jgi:hypothetical protein